MDKKFATVEQVTRIVERVFGIPDNILETKGVVFQLYKDGRVNYNPSYIHHRMIAMHFCRLHTELYLSDIAKAFNTKDHGTVIHASKWVQNMLDIGDNVYAYKIRKIEQRLANSFLTTRKDKRDYEKKERKG